MANDKERYLQKIKKQLNKERYRDKDNATVQRGEKYRPWDRFRCILGFFRQRRYRIKTEE